MRRLYVNINIQIGISGPGERSSPTMSQLVVVALLLSIPIPSVIQFAGAVPSQNLLIPNVTTFAGQGSVTTLFARAPFTCSQAVTSSSGYPEYDTQPPYALQSIIWMGGGTSRCTAAMTSISFDLWVIDPQGIRHTIAARSCVNCLVANALDTGYMCTQTGVGGLCAGEWQVSVEVVIVAPTLFTDSSGHCVAGGRTLTCRATSPPLYIPLFDPTPPPPTAKPTTTSSSGPSSTAIRTVSSTSTSTSTPAFSSNGISMGRSGGSMLVLSTFLGVVAASL